MGADKQGSKVGVNYVGGFLHLFDWNVKSRKKLFASKSDFPERLKQGKRNDSNFPMTRVCLGDEDDVGAVESSFKCSSDYSCSSSLTDEDGYGTKAPGVIARLMGLDSLPKLDSSEPVSTPFFDFQSHGDICYQRKPVDIYNENHVDGSVRNTTLDLKPRKISNRPIQKFQTEILPPKSAKSIPSTQHKLLSPIKGPGFARTKNVAQIMEAAAKIIDHGSQVTSSKAKISPVGALKVRDMREKLDVRSRQHSRFGERPIESNAAKYLKGESLNCSSNGSVDASSSSSSSFRVYNDAKGDNCGKKNKGKSVSLAVQAKANVERRGSLNHSASRGLAGEREENELSLCQPNVQKSAQKKNSSSHNASGVLRQNHQKQSCLDKDTNTSRTLGCNVQRRKAVSKEPLVGRHKSAKKHGFERTDIEKYSKTNNLRSKKRSLDGDSHFQGNRILDDPLNKHSEKPVQLNKRFSFAEELRENGLDVVSFSFTAPMARSNSSSDSSNCVGEKNSSLFPDRHGKRMLVDSDSARLSTLGFNVIGGDALSLLLEQKLKELNYGIESNSMPKLHDRSYYDPFNSTIHPGCKKFQGRKEVDVYDGDRAEAREPSPVSILEPFPSQSWNSSDSIESNAAEGRRPCFSVEAPEAMSSTSSRKSHSFEIETELSDSASSTTPQARKNKEAAAWEVEYVNDILSNLESMFMDFALGRSHEMVNPRLFELLEKRAKDQGKDFKIARRAVFDCASECVQSRFQYFVGGGCAGFGKGVEMARRKERMGEDVYREICGWKGMGDCMVDELVDKDMSSQYGKWAGFEVETFVLGVDLQGRILDSLVDELVADIL